MYINLQRLTGVEGGTIDYISPEGLNITKREAEGNVFFSRKLLSLLGN